MQHTTAKNMALGQLITSEVLDPRILQAMVEVPRENFVPERLRHAAYADEDLEIAPGRYLMAPLTLARLLDLAKIQPDSRVLVVGALTGYPAAIVSRLSSRVTAIECDTYLPPAPGIRIERVEALANGYPHGAPYDVILLCGASWNIPGKLAEQLSQGGRIAMVQAISSRPGEPGGMGRGTIVTLTHNQILAQAYFDAPARILPGFSAENAFVFQ